MNRLDQKLLRAKAKVQKRDLEAKLKEEEDTRRQDICGRLNDGHIWNRYLVPGEYRYEHRGVKCIVCGKKYYLW